MPLHFVAKRNEPFLLHLDVLPNPFDSLNFTINLISITYFHVTKDIYGLGGYIRYIRPRSPNMGYMYLSFFFIICI